MFLDLQSAVSISSASQLCKTFLLQIIFFSMTLLLEILLQIIIKVLYGVTEAVRWSVSDTMSLSVLAASRNEWKEVITLLRLSEWKEGLLSHPDMGYICEGIL